MAGTKSAKLGTGMEIMGVSLSTNVEHFLFLSIVAQDDPNSCQPKVA